MCSATLDDGGDVDNNDDDDDSNNDFQIFLAILVIALVSNEMSVFSLVGYLLTPIARHSKITWRMCRTFVKAEPVASTLISFEEPLL